MNTQITRTDSGDIYWNNNFIGHYSHLDKSLALRIWILSNLAHSRCLQMVQEFRTEFKGTIQS